MVNVGLFVLLEAKPGKETDVARLLESAQPLLKDEPATVAWLAVQFGPSTFAIFNAFPDEAGREEHLAGKIAASLMASAPELFVSPPKIEKFDVVASRLPL
jgi:quinol monooxygenase YgiN